MNDTFVCLREAFGKCFTYGTSTLNLVGLTLHSGSLLDICVTSADNRLQYQA